MTVKQPVSASLARAFFYIVLLSLLSTGVALVTLASSLRDAEAVNIAGSLRMQSYRLGYDLERSAIDTSAHRQIYQESLNSPVLQQLNRWYVPDIVGKRYAQLQESWTEMDARVAAKDRDWYQNNIQQYVANIDQFVLALQHYSERKMLLVVGISLLGAVGIFMLVFFTLQRIRQQVVKPLNQLMVASQHIQQGHFTYPLLNAHLDNELGLLASTFDRMSGELHKLYRTLEAQVEEKTHDLHEAHRRLEVLYQCSQALNTGQIDEMCFRHILQIVHDHQAATFLALRVGEHWAIEHGALQDMLPVSTLPVGMQEKVFGELRWQSPAAQASAPLMQSVATIIGRGIYFNQAQKHYQQLMLLEERATIAGELHDSLAQVLSYLRIQLALLKRAVPEENLPAQTIIADFSKALNDAWRQLRELLTTFRLSVSQSDLPAALREALDILQSQTSAALTLDCRLPTLALDAQQQVNVLQIVREAVINAIKHANATAITVSCVTDPDGLYSVYIRDNGKGIGDTRPEGHFGLSIMRERAERLDGTLIFSRPPGGGTLVQFRFPVAELSSKSQQT
ncbi:nitrate/nitrite two-component system sensor histidine kinase NarQ [Phytobacter sp. V91]|uniref:nitrate/nitrite two-component system sensor histidine kinase NarQ n=1 Tax=Phytobacter sp. V91 TaxID=3369425 RepID=UPI003F62DD3D